MVATDDSKSFSLGSNPSKATIKLIKFMKKPIYFGEGISEHLKYFAHSDKYKKYEPLTSNYFIMGSRMYEMYTLLMQKENKQIDPDLADLKIRAIGENAYLHSGWNYLKYPQTNLSNSYQNSFTNEIFEEIDRESSLIYVGRC